MTAERWRMKRMWEAKARRSGDDFCRRVSKEGDGGKS
jgi:hypothetical protein